MENKLEIRITYRLIIYLIYIICAMFFVAKAFLVAYSPPLAGVLFVIYAISYPLSMFLIRKEVSE